MRDDQYFNAERRRRRQLAEIERQREEQERQERIEAQREAMRQRPHGLPSEANK